MNNSSVIYSKNPSSLFSLFLLVLIYWYGKLRLYLRSEYLLVDNSPVSI